MERLTYQTSPIVTFATNRFIHVPIILQYDETPLISVVQEQALGYTSEFRIYHEDGTYLAKVRGTRVFPTEEGKKAGLQLSEPKGMTVCKLDGRTVFEIYHETGDAFRAHAELYTPDGCFVKSANTPPSIVAKNGQPLRVGGTIMSGNTFSGVRIGVWFKSDGQCMIGVS